MFWNIDKQFEKLGYEKRHSNDIYNVMYVKSLSGTLFDVIEFFHEYDDFGDLFKVAAYKAHKLQFVNIGDKLLTYKELKLCAKKIKQLQREMKKVKKERI